jgi:SagB-type dehydrogenase family enzyme
LPAELRQTGIAALSAISTSVPPNASAVPDLEAIAQLLFLSAGITRQRKYPGGEIYFRAAACTGALYEIELYLVCGDLPKLPAGVYHFAPAEFGLRRLRTGDYRGVLVEAIAAERAVAHAPLTIVCTATYWRNAWKYQARTYRHFGWDNGTLLANFLAVATALGLPAKVVCGFVDATVNRLLDLDSEREVAFSLIPIGYQASIRSQNTLETTDVPALGFETVPLSGKEIDYPVMRAMHAASSLNSPEDVAEWRENSALAIHEMKGNSNAPSAAPFDGSRYPLQPLSEAEMPRDPIEQVILRRGSSRRFARTAISFTQLSTMLDRATRGVPADFLNSDQDSRTPHLNDIYLIVHAVEGLEPGAYSFNRDAGVLECLKRGDFRDQAGYLGLEQQLPADAAVDIFFLADLNPILNRLGNRGYRAVQLEAGITGGKLYLAAYAQRLGATGLTFYDDDVTSFFSPHGAGKSAIFLVAVGHSAQRHAA